MAFVVLHDAETVQVLEPAAMVQLAGVVRVPEATAFASEQAVALVFVPPFSPLQPQVYELAPSTLLTLVPEVQE